MSIHLFDLLKRNKETAAVASGISLLTFLALSAIAALVFHAGPASLGGVLGPAASSDSSGAAHVDFVASDGDERDVVQAIEKTNPSVVSIVVSQDVPIAERFYRRYGPFPFMMPGTNDNGSEQVEVAGGSGFLVSSDGLIATNKHVVGDKDSSYAVFTNDGKKYDAEVVATDPYFDIAFLRIRGSTAFPYLEFGDSDNLRLGQTVIAIGNALSEFHNSVSVGVVSGLSRSILAGDRAGGSPELLEQVIQTDAAINPGNSGGPLLDTSGKVIGINVAVAEGSENIGFALPASVAANALASVRSSGTIIHPYLGVRTISITPELAEEESLPVDNGALVMRGESISAIAVIPDSPASKAGIKEGDIILDIDGKQVTEDVSLAQLIRTRHVGDAVKLTVMRDGKKMAVEAVLERAPESLG